MQPELSVIIPTYNESKNIQKTLMDVSTYLSEKQIPSEIIVVDDGSSDDTVTIVKHFQKQGIPLRLIESRPNRGKGYVVKRGMMEGAGKYLLFMDADQATKITELDKFLPKIDEGYEILIGSRRLKNRNVHIVQPKMRQYLGWFYLTLSKMILKIPQLDYNCGFKFYQHEAAKKIFQKQLMNDWSFDVELILLAQKYDFKISEVAVNWTHGEGSKVHPLKDGVRSFLALLKIKKNELQGKYRIEPEERLQSLKKSQVPS